MRKIVFLTFILLFFFAANLWANVGYTPTGYNLAAGTEAALSATSAGWKGSFANDTVYWATNNLTSGVGLDKELYFDGVNLKGANKLIIYYGGYVSNANLAYQVQIWDVVNSVWRPLNERNTNLTNTSDADSTFEIYDGYWQSGNSPVSTPLANFVDTGNNNRVTLRLYSAYIGASRIHYLDHLQLEVAIDPYYEAAGFTEVTGGAVTNTYDYTFTSDNNRVTVANNVSQALQYYFSFDNVKTYPDANTIMVAYEGLVSNAALTYDVQIYNFTAALWENLNATTLSNTTETTYYFAKSNINLSDYINNGEVRVGIQTNAPASARTHSTDLIYIIVGSVNTDQTLSEVSFGTEAGGTTAANTTTLDTSSADSTWQQATAASSASAYYSLDRAGTWGTNYSASSNLSFPITVPSGYAVTGIRVAARFRSNSTANTAALSMKDFTGLDAATGGWVDAGLTNATTALTFYTTTYTSNSPDFIDSTNNLGNLRLRTSVSTATATVTRDWDFALMSIRWVEEPIHTSIQYGYTPTGYSLGMGTEAALSATSAGWKGVFANDAVYWATNNTTGGGGGLDKEIYIDGVDLKGANKLIIYEGGYVSNAALVYQVQIWDVVNSVWRPLNERNTTLANTADADRTWEIFDGYWQSGNSPVSTPLTNFVDTANNNRVTLRIYSAYTAASYVHYLDRMDLEVATDPYYEAAAFTKVTGGAVTNTYDYTFTTDNNRITVANNAGQALQYYFSFNNVGAYTGANAIVVTYEGLVSNAALTYRVQIYNFNTALWENLNATVLSNTAEATYYFAKSNVTLSDYMSSDGEIRVGIQSNAPAAAYTHSTDLINIIIGSVNTDVGLSEVSFGTQAGGTTAANTATLDTSSADSTWQHTTVASSAATYYPLDRAGTWNTNYSASSNLSFPITVPLGSKITGIRLAARFRSNVAANTAALSLKDYSGLNASTGGWVDSGLTNANTTLTFNTTTYQNNLTDFIDSTNNLGNLKLRTSVSTATAAVTRDWDFAMMSIRWVSLTTGPTAAKVASLQADYKAGNIVISFATKGEVAVRGFQVYKTLTPGNTKTYIPVAKFMPSAAGPISGKSYSVIDTDPNVNYYYILGISNKGKGISYIGPVAVGQNINYSDSSGILSRSGLKTKNNTLNKAKPIDLFGGEIKKINRSNLNRLPAGKQLFKIGVEEDGIYRVSRKDLQDAGMEPGNFNSANLKLANYGKIVPVFFSGDYLEFYGQAQNTRYTNRNIYWLVAKKAGKEMEKKPALNAGNTVPYYLQEVRLEENVNYYPEVNGKEHWFYGEEIFSPYSREFELTLDNLYPQGQGAVIAVAMQGFSHGLFVGNGLQKIKLYLNDNFITEGQWYGDTYYICQADIDPSVLKDGPNILRIEAPDENGTLPQMALLDKIQLIYPRRFVAQNDSLKFAGKSGSASYEIQGFSSEEIKALDITEPENPVQVSNVTVRKNGAGFTARFNNPDKYKHTYYVFAGTFDKSPAEITLRGSSDLLKRSNQADMIVIAYKDFLDGLKPLVSLREAQGLKVKVVDVEDIYDAFNFGVFSPEAIKKFLQYAYFSWQKPSPKYVLLAGDGTFDYKDYYGTGTPNLVPAYLVSGAAFGEGPSDSWFVAFENNSLPKMMVGRFPVNNTGELDAVVSKVINYENCGYISGRHLFVADADPNRVFSMLSDQISGKLPQTEIKEKLYLDDSDAASVHLGIVEQLNNGVSFVNYTGHGGISLWSDNRIFTNQDVASLSNSGKYPFFITLTCADGYFVYPQGILDSMGEVLLLAPDKGAIGGIFPSIVSSSEEQKLFSDGFYQAIFNKGADTFGEAVKQAKQYLFDNNSPNVRTVVDTYNLLGDPAVKIRK
ncbi:MAG: C25 family cysteine peptidase [Candidatus Omnitrophica bacterium]|nr:C25 family cysteine peptidase [Candidatus Omnitrophota bacterium]